MAIAEVSKDRMAIRFGGTAAQVESAFHTEIHNLRMYGGPHIANMSDPEIPAALSPVVAGVKGLNDFHPRPLHDWEAWRGSILRPGCGRGFRVPEGAVILKAGSTLCNWRHRLKAAGWILGSLAVLLLNLRSTEPADPNLKSIRVAERRTVQLRRSKPSIDENPISALPVVEARIHMAKTPGLMLYLTSK
jgi:hypothetical protein